MSAVVALMVAAVAILASGAGAASLKLITNIGNGGGGPIVKQANAIAKKDLVGPKGSGLTRGITASQVTVGCVYTAADYVGYQDGIQAAFAQANKTGIYGRKLKLIPCLDDASNGQTNVTENQQLVNEDHVFSVLNLSQFELPGSTDFLNSNQVPYIGWGYNPGFCGYRWGFGWNGCLGGNGFKEPIEAIAGNLSQAIIKASGLKPSKIRFAVEAVNAISGVQGNAQFSALFKAAGAKVVYQAANYPSVSTGVDNTPYVQAILANKPNVIFLSTPFSDIGALSTALKAAGYKGVIQDFVAYIPGLLASSPQLAASLQGQYINSQIVPATENTPYIQQIESGLAAIGQPKFVTLGAFMGYAEADMLIQMLKATGKNLNTKTFDQKVNGGSFTSYSSGPTGGPGKVIWPGGHYLPADCAAIVRVSGDNYKVVEPFSCYQSYKVAG